MNIPEMQPIDANNTSNQQLLSYYNAPMNSTNSNIIVLTNPDPEIEKMKLTFRGFKMDADGNLEKVGEPLMNEQGIQAIAGATQSLVNQVTVLSNLSRNEISNIMKYQFLHTVTKSLMLNKKRYDIGMNKQKIYVDRVLENGMVMTEIKEVIEWDRTSRDLVHMIAFNTAFACIMRAREGDDKKFFKGTQHEQIMNLSGGTAQNTKGLSSLMNMFGKK